MTRDDGWGYEWVQEPNGDFTRGDYRISPFGNGWQLHYNGVLLATRFTPALCKADADYHRGVSWSGAYGNR